MGPAALIHADATGVLASNGRTVTAVTLAGGAAAAATAVLRTGGGSGAVLLTIAAPQGDTAHVVFPASASFHNGIHVTLTGAGAAVAVAYE